MTTMSMDQSQQPTGFKLFGLRGRMGRSRYILACLGAAFAVFIVLLVVKSLMMLFGHFGMMVTYTIGVILYFGALPGYIAMLTVRRAHDFNLGGWMALLILLPLLSPWFSPVPLLFWFMPGSRGDNLYGPARPKEKLSIKLLAGGLPILLLVIFIASVKPPSASPSASTPSSTLKQYKP